MSSYRWPRQKKGQAHLWVSDKGHPSPHNTEAGLPGVQGPGQHAFTTRHPTFSPLSSEPCGARGPSENATTFLLSSDYLKVTSLASNKITKLAKAVLGARHFSPSQPVCCPDTCLSTCLFCSKPSPLIRMTAARAGLRGQRRDSVTVSLLKFHTSLTAPKRRCFKARWGFPGAF